MSKARAATLYVLVALALLMLLVAVVWPIPELLTSTQTSALTAADLLKAQNDIRTTLVGMLAGLATIAGIVVALSSLRLSRSGQFTDRYRSSVDQLNSASLSSRIGAVYALDRLGRDSAFDRRAVVEVLSAFVRASAPDRTEEGDPVVPADAQAALTVFAKPWVQEHSKSVNLMNTILCHSDLRKQRLSGINMAGADLSFSDLRECKLANAKLSKADFKGADLRGADLSNADISQADLRGAQLYGAIIQPNQLSTAILS